MKKVQFLSTTVLAVMLAASLLTGCTESLSDDAVAASSDRVSDVVRVNPIDGGNTVTTRATDSWNEFTRFSMFGYFRSYKRGRLANANEPLLAEAYQESGSQYVRLENGSWDSDGNLNWHGQDTTSMFAISPGLDAIKHLTIASDPRTFDLDASPDNQVLVKVGSRLNIVRPESGSMDMTFNNVLSPFRLSIGNKLKKTRVIVSSVTLHNLISKGCFTFSTTEEARGSVQPLKTDGTLWNSETDGRGLLLTSSYQRDAEDADGTPAPIEVKTRGSSPITQSPVAFVLPQTVMSWVPTGTNDASNTTKRWADPNALAYFEVKCRIIETLDDGSEKYVVGWPDEKNAQNPDYYPKYESVYFPYDSNPNYQPRFNYIVPYVLYFSENAIYNEYGGIITDHDGALTNFENADWIEMEGDDENVDDWDDSGTSVDLDM